MKLTILGIINFTPDSFSDGGQYTEPLAFKKHVEKLWKDGVDLLDIGVESTAPQNQSLNFEQEQKRWQTLLPLLKEVELGQALSIDTYRPATLSFVANQLPASVQLIWNDVSGVLDQKLLKFLQNHPQITYVFSHTMVPKREWTGQHLNFSWGIDDDHLISEMVETFQKAAQIFSDYGVLDRIIFDPALGFSKTREQNIFLLKHLDKVITQFSTSQRWLLGLSRKSFLRSEEINKEQLWAYSDLLQASIMGALFQRLEGHDIWLRLHAGPLGKSLRNYYNDYYLEPTIL